MAALNSLGYFIARTHKSLKKKFTPIVNRFDLTEPQYGILRCLYYQDGLSARDLVDLIFMDSSTVMAVVDRLEKKHLVRREPHPVDRRLHRIVLTDQAKALLPTLIAEVDALDRILRKQLSAKELAVLVKGLNKLYQYATTPHEK
jgi:DNA-binding MarR family transcriptional regulator